MQPAAGVWTFSSRVLLQPREACDFHLPDGRFENSPPFQRWDCVVEGPSPEGTVESIPQIPRVVGNLERAGIADALPNANRRYGRVQLCATEQPISPTLEFWPQAELWRESLVKGRRRLRVGQDALMLDASSRRTGVAWLSTVVLDRFPAVFSPSNH